jgi:dihydrodipicolinate synthase/N-acetylneuraminate lyase
MLPTAFDISGEVDASATIDMVERASDEHATIAVSGFGSECLHLTVAERQLILKLAGRHKRAGTALVVGASARTRSDSQTLVKQAADGGADVIMLAPPVEVASTDEAIDFMHRAVEWAGASALMVQDAPQWSGAPLGAAGIKRLALLHPDCICYVKPEDLPYPDSIAALSSGSDLVVYSGLGGSSFEDARRLGAEGVIPLLDSSAALQRYSRIEDVVAAEHAFRQILPFLVFEMQTLEFAITCAKTVLGWSGYQISPATRVEGPPLSARVRDTLRLHADRAGVITRSDDCEDGGVRLELETTDPGLE